ncbi:MAG: hypothetical protein H7240_02575 [Glaciimonas sp.]|nr:hypothetical protein [Glaciimonas sp.]
MSFKFTKLAFTLASIFVLSACGENTQDAAKTGAVISAIAQKYEGKIVHQPAANRGKDDGWYLVKNGKRSWITDGSWLAKNGFQPDAVAEISSADFNAIPEDPQPLK